MNVTLYADNNVLLNLEYNMLKSHNIQKIRGIFNVTVSLSIAENHSSLTVSSNYCVRGLEFLPTVYHLEANYSVNRGEVLFEFLGPLTSAVHVYIEGNDSCYNILIVGDKFLLYFLPSKEDIGNILESLGFSVEELREKYSKDTFEILIKAKMDTTGIKTKLCKISILRGRIILEGSIKCKISLKNKLLKKLGEILALYFERTNNTKIYRTVKMLLDNIALRRGSSLYVEYVRVLKTNSTAETIKIKHASLRTVNSTGIEGTARILSTLFKACYAISDEGLNKTTIAIIEGDNSISIDESKLLIKPYKIKYVGERKTLIFNSLNSLLEISNFLKRREVLDRKQSMFIIASLAIYVLVLVSIRRIIALKRLH